MSSPDPEIFEIFREEAAERLDRMVETLELSEQFKRAIP